MMKEIERKGLAKLKQATERGQSDVSLLRDRDYQSYLLKVEKIGTENKSHVNAARLNAMNPNSKFPLATPENRNKVY